MNDSPFPIIGGYILYDRLVIFLLARKQLANTAWAI